MDELQLRREFIAGTKFEGLRLEGWNGEVAKPTWFLDKLIPGRSIGMVYGPSNSGKTHLVVDMAMHAVTAAQWCGMDLDEGPIVVFAESIGNFQNRLAAYLAKIEKPQKHPIHVFSPVGIRVGDYARNEDGELIRANDIRDLANFITFALNCKPSMVLFDTFSTSFDFGDKSENDNGAVAELMRDLERYLLVEEVMTNNGIIAFMHHTSKASGGHSARGASALEGNIDWSVRVEYSKEFEATVAYWSKDRWRMIDKPPVWLAKKHPQLVNFSDGPDTINIHEWVFFDPEEEQASAELERESKIDGAIRTMTDIINENINSIGYAFIPEVARKDVRGEFAAGVVMASNFANAHDAKAVKAYFMDGKSGHTVEPKYNTAGKIHGYYLTK